MKGANTGGRARPATPGATPSRRSSLHVSPDHSHAQCAGSLRRSVFKDLDENPNPGRPCSLHFPDSSSHTAPQRRFSVPRRPIGSVVGGDRVLGRVPMPHASNEAACLSSISADLVRRTQGDRNLGCAPAPHASNEATALSSINADLVSRTQGDAPDNVHPVGMHQQKRRFSSHAAFSSSRTACTPSSSASSSSSSFPYNINSRSSAAAALKSSVLHSTSKISLPEKLALDSECSPCMRRCSIGHCVNVTPLSTNFTTSSSTDPLPSSSDDMLESRLRRMTLRSDTKAARKAAARRDSLIDYQDEDDFEANNSPIDVDDFWKDDCNGNDEVPFGGLHTQDEAKCSMMPPRGLSCLVGLYNEGNTCYLNSCIQCLVHTMPLAAVMLNGKVDFLEHREWTDFGGSKRFLKRTSSFSMQGYGGESVLRRLNEAISLAREFRNLLTRMWSSSCPPYSVASASAFLRCVQSWDSQFLGYQQQDAQEVMRAILDGLHEALNRVKNRHYMDIYREYESRPEDELAAITWNYHKSLNDSLIQDIFCGQLQSSIECSVCRMTSHCFDPFLDLSLPLPEHGGSLLGTRFNKCRVSILDCLASFVALETLSGRERYKCANCKIPQLSTKKLSIYRVPTILVLHLKRFHGSGPFFKKDDTPVSYPLRGLDLTEFLGTTSQGHYPHGALYDLYAVCNHSGSLGYGHYTAQCKDADGLWYSFNDSLVSTSNESSVVSSSAYILFYQLRHA
ncbi:hypothetical protein GOP47_0026737 [Adiantum capillus-veneris]|nr:hypothetical protein GOP47_0026737 [Adiantum capillus-veneris]